MLGKFGKLKRRDQQTNQARATNFYVCDPQLPNEDQIKKAQELGATPEQLAKNNTYKEMQGLIISLRNQRNQKPRRK